MNNKSLSDQFFEYERLDLGGVNAIDSAVLTCLTEQLLKACVTHLRTTPSNNITHKKVCSLFKEIQSESYLVQLVTSSDSPVTKMTGLMYEILCRLLYKYFPDATICYNMLITEDEDTGELVFTENGCIYDEAYKFLREILG